MRREPLKGEELERETLKGEELEREPLKGEESKRVLLITAVSIPFRSVRLATEGRGRACPVLDTGVGVGCSQQT